MRGVEFLAPFLADNAKWPRPPDVLYWKEWPVHQPARLFGAVVGSRSDWLALGQSLEVDPVVEKARRNFPIRFSTLWHP